MAVMRKVKENIKKIIKRPSRGKKTTIKPVAKRENSSDIRKKSDISQHRRDPFQFKRTRWG